MLAHGPGRVRQTILNKCKGSSGISRIIGTDEQGIMMVTTDPEEVREQTRVHFDDMFHPHPVHPELLTKWIQEYMAKGHPEQYPASQAE
ncbi:hypothetical protein H4S07_002824, partial [Coemansia furcata]